MEEIWIINDEIVIETWRETESELEIIELGLEEKELKTKGSLNGDIKVSLPINTQFWEADVRYEVLEEGKVSITDIDKFVSQSSNPKIL